MVTSRQTCSPESAPQNDDLNSVLQHTCLLEEHGEGGAGPGGIAHTTIEEGQTGVAGALQISVDWRMERSFWIWQGMVSRMW